MSNNSEVGLRARKRAATQLRIQHAALTLVLKHGIEQTTIDEISRLANISPRTFFNYFPTKDAAVVGDVPGFVSEESLERFVNAGPGGPILVQLEELLISNLEPLEEDEELHQLRQEVLQSNSQLIGMRMSTLRGFESRLQELLERRLTVDHPELAADSQSLTEQALLYTLVAVAAMRHAWRCWADSAGQVNLADRLRSSFGDVYKIALETR